MSDAIEAERKRAIAAIHWVFNADGTVGERAMAQEAIHKINDPTFMPALTAYEAAKGGGVGVKPLEWLHTGNADVGSDESDEADTPFGGYVISIDPFSYSPTTAYYVDGPNWFKGQYASAVEAKAAAQAEYDARIRSALTSPASGERDAATASDESDVGVIQSLRDNLTEAVVALMAAELVLSHTGHEGSLVLMQVRAVIAKSDGAK